MTSSSSSTYGGVWMLTAVALISIVVLAVAPPSDAVPADTSLERFGAAAAEYAEHLARGDAGPGLGFDPEGGPVTAGVPVRLWRIGGEDPAIVPSDQYMVAIAQDGTPRTIVEGRELGDGTVEPGSMGGSAAVAAAAHRMGTDERLVAFRFDAYFVFGPEEARVVTGPPPLRDGEVLAHDEVLRWYTDQVGVPPPSGPDAGGAAGLAAVAAVAATLVVLCAALLVVQRRRRGWSAA